MSTGFNMRGAFFHISPRPVLFEDNHLLAVYKPAGLLIQSDRTGDVSLLELAKGYLKDKYQKPGNVFLGMVHRLDRPAAGVVLFGRTSKAAGRLSEQFRTGRVEKRYLAIVEGKPGRQSGNLVQHLERRGKGSSRIVPAPTPRSREARLSFRLLDVSNAASLIEVLLETGRHHQIRAQLSHMGHPILGDLRYGAAAPLPHAQIALLALELTVRHPTSGKSIRFASPLPQDWPWPPSRPNPSGPPWTWRQIAF